MKNKLYLYIILLQGLLASCSTTRNIPKDDQLYTGIKKIVIEKDSGVVLPPALNSNLTTPLAYAPNNALFGSSSIRLPFPVGLWIYNAFETPPTKGLKKWFYNTFSRKPVLISNVQPDLRVKVVESMLRDFGYFEASTSMKLIDGKNPKTAKIEYFIHIPKPYLFDSIQYVLKDTRADSIIRSIEPQSLLRMDEQYSVQTLENEQTRVAKVLRNDGYFYYRPEYLLYLADTTQVKDRVMLRVVRDPILPPSVLKPYTVDTISVQVDVEDNGEPIDTIHYKGLDIYYQGKLKVRPSVLRRNIALHRGDLYSQAEQTRTLQNLNRLNIFKYVNLQFAPVDSSAYNPRLNMLVNSELEMPWQAEIEMNVAAKSNDQIGPGLLFTVSNNNTFGGGEKLAMQLKASYEWQTKAVRDATGSKSLLNSYEFGLTTSLTFPRILLPHFIKSDGKFPRSTKMSVNADLLSRAGFFQMLSLGGGLSYDFQTSPSWYHSLRAFKLDYTSVLHSTAKFDSTMAGNPAIELSFRNQFIPSMGYTVTYEPPATDTKKNRFFWQGSFVEAGNILSGIYGITGRHKNDTVKTLFGSQFSQFVKFTSDFRWYHQLSKKTLLAFRLYGGIGIPYGNSSVMPYSEQFYIGGANSIRAFTIRSLGPGSYRPPKGLQYSYIDQTGNIKLEFNAEYRFPIIEELHGAVFLDAGNIWLLHNDPKRPGGTLRAKTFLKDIAVGTGVGLRYDLTFLVIRGDLGIAIHTPYPNPDKSGYYNIANFKDGLCFHLAIGYPF